MSPWRRELPGLLELLALLIERPEGTADGGVAPPYIIHVDSEYTIAAAEGTSKVFANFKQIRVLQFLLRKARRFRRVALRWVKGHAS